MRGDKSQDNDTDSVSSLVELQSFTMSMFPLFSTLSYKYTSFSGPRPMMLGVAQGCLQATPPSTFESMDVRSA